MLGHSEGTPPDDYSRTGHLIIKSSKRKCTNTDDMSTNEQPADEPWYALKHEEVVFMVEDMCDKLLYPMQRFISVDRQIRELIHATKSAKILPSVKHLSLAVLGEQGVGKSTVINALLDRKILGTSGSTKAWTAYATIVEHKQGASDLTDLSDITVEFLNEKEIAECIKEQIHRLAEVHNGHPSHPREDVDQGSDPGSYDSSDESIATHKVSEDGKAAKKISKSEEHAASTAFEFFQIIFNIEDDFENMQWLQQELQDTDIRGGQFFETCLHQAQERITEVGTKLGVRDAVSRIEDISDRDFEKMQGFIRKLWPFVKVVTIATGNILLRHGLRFFDLPGYGDTSQLREAIVNEFRWKADFEMVVAPSSRLQTSTKHDRYIGRSIHLKGANKTILVMNKSDGLINADNVGNQIREIREPPFPALTDRLENIYRRHDEGEDKGVLSRLMNELCEEATVAYISYETKRVQNKMQAKGITVFSASAIKYLNSMNPFQNEDLSMDKETSGIPTLRSFLRKLPAAANFRNYQNHIFQVLPDLRKQAGRILEDHTEEQTYAAMRQDLKRQIPLIERHLQDLVNYQVRALVESPWSLNDEQCAVHAIQDLAQNTWVHRIIHQRSFTKILRENGIPVNGAQFGYNMNDKLLKTMKKYIQAWYDMMNQRSEQLAQDLSAPIDFFLSQIRSCIDKTSAHPHLKYRACEELDVASARIRTVNNALVFDLHRGLHENYLRFTTEIDIKCPIAVWMKPCYDLALDPAFVGTGAGIYDRQRNLLLNLILDPAQYQSYGCASLSLLRSHEENLLRCQLQSWTLSCDTFVTNSVALIEKFSCVAEDLLTNPTSTSVQSEMARSELKDLLIVFDKSLTELQEHFDNAERGHSRKKIKCDDGTAERKHRTAALDFLSSLGELLRRT